MWIALLAAASLHSCGPAHGDRILMRDLAGVDPRFAAADQTQAVGFAPGPGATRVFWPAELSNIAKRNGIESGQLFHRVCFEWPMRRLTADEIVGAIRAWAPENARIAVAELSKFPVPPGPLAIPRPVSASPALDGAVLLRGFVTFGNGQRFPTWARVRIGIKRTVVVAAGDIAAAADIRSEQLRIEERECGIEALQFASSLGQAVGSSAKRRIPAGSPVTLAALGERKEVMRGALVKVEVRDGGALLAFDGRAEESGRGGDTVRVRNPASGKDFAAQVTGVNRVLVTPAGAPDQDNVDK